jgi:hypothetical protein
VAAVKKLRELNTGKEELWAKFSEKTEVTVVTRLKSLSSSEIGESKQIMDASLANPKTKIETLVLI